MNNQDKRLILNRDQIEDRIRSLAQEISKDYQNKDLILIGILNGVFMFFSDLVKAMTIPVRIDFVRLASYGTKADSSGQIKMTKDVETDLTDQHVLIVEDIVDSGLTLDWLRKHLADLGAASIKACVLIDKLERREKDIILEYTGFEVQSGFLVGYGLDFNNRYRDLTDIYHLVMPDNQGDE